MAKLVYLAISSIDGGGKRSLSHDGFMKLELLDEHRFESRFVYMRYRTTQFNGG